MKRLLCVSILSLFFMQVFNQIALAQNVIPANDPDIQYYGRWDFSDPLAPTHSWPGVYVYAKFEGTSIGVRMADDFCYYNVIIDGQLVKILHGDQSALKTYTVALGLADTIHSILFTKRDETSWTKFSFNGFVLDDNKNLVTALERPDKKIEFIGDSYTVASGNEYTEEGTPPDTEPVTNVYEGFAGIIGRHFGAQYTVTARSGFGLVVDWTGDYSNNIPDYFDRTLFYTEFPKWDFEQWIPNLVVICLGLNDYSGFGGYTDSVNNDQTNLFKTTYHDFIARIRDLYPGVKILAVAAHVEWIQQKVREVVDEEKAAGNDDVFYSFFPYYEGGYVNNGHPDVETHYKIADTLIAAIDTINAWEPYIDNTPPKFTKLPKSPFVCYNTQLQLDVITDSYATVRYSTEDKAWADMENTFSATGKRNHSTLIPCEHGKQYTYYLRAADIHGNATDTSAVITFSVDTTKKLYNWKQLNYINPDWKSGKAPLGYGSGNDSTTLNGVKTVYFRHKFTVEDTSLVNYISFFAELNDGAAFYLNGQQVLLINIYGDMSYDLPALSAEATRKSYSVSGNELQYLQDGENILAVEVHTANVENPDLSFDLKVFTSGANYILKKSTWEYYDGGTEPADIVTALTGKSPETPVQFELQPNYPNPFNPTTVIRYQIAVTSRVKLTVYDVLGRQVSTLIDKTQNAGKYEIVFNGTAYSSGIYYCKLETSAGFNASRKMILLK